MWSKQLTFLLVAAVACLSWSCNLNDLTDTIIVSEVEEEFYVDLWEELGDPSAGLTFQIRTINEEDCKNYEIVYQFTRTVNRLRISLEKIKEPEDCDPGLAPARADISAGVLGSGFFDLRISLRNTINNEGLLTVNQNRYVVTMDDPDGIIFLHKELLRIPMRTIWGYIHYPAPEDEGLAQQFLSELTPLLNYRELPNGYYGHFTIDESNLLTLREQPPSTTTLTFASDLPEGNRQAVLDLLADYRNEYGGQLDIKLYTWEGEVW